MTTTGRCFAAALTASLVAAPGICAIAAFALLAPATFAQEGAQVGAGAPAPVADPSPIATPIEVSDEEAAQHLTRRVTPRYPPLAKTARIQGNVGLALRVSPEGSVDVSVISGHPMLAGAAMDAAKQWRFAPFIREGHPVAANVKVEIAFTLNESGESSRAQQLSEGYDKQEHICRQFIERRLYAKAEAECITLAKLAEKLPPGYLGVCRQAYAYAGDAFWFQGKLPEARAWYQRELSVVEALMESQGNIGSRELAHAYYDAAHGSQGIGEFARARLYYERAEKVMEEERKQAESALRKAESEKSASESAALRDDAQSEKDYWRETSESLLRDYAGLLRAMGDTRAAEKAGRKAQSLSRPESR